MNEDVKSVMPVWTNYKRSWIATYANGERRHLGYNPLEGGAA